MNNHKVYETITRVRAIMPNNLFVGGSWALKKFFYNTEHIVPGDLDFFYYGPRPMEHWTFELLLKAVGFEILKSQLNYDGIYKMEGQYWYFKCKDTNGIIFDIICIQPYYEPLEIFGSTLACVQYQVAYYCDEDILRLPEKYTEGGSLRTVMDRLKETNVVEVFPSKCTDDHLEKIKRRCELLGLKFVNKGL